MQSPQCHSLICLLLWTSHLQSCGGKGKGRRINFVQLVVYCTRGFIRKDCLTYIQCFELIIKSHCLVMVVFHIIRSYVFVKFEIRKPKYQIWMSWWRRRGKSQQSHLHWIAVPMLFSLFFVCFG